MYNPPPENEGAVFRLSPAIVHVRTKNSNLAKMKAGTYITSKVPVCINLGFKAKYFCAIGTTSDENASHFLY
mgnify:CR=1 FL=1